MKMACLGQFFRVTSLVLIQDTPAKAEGEDQTIAEHKVGSSPQGPRKK